MNIKVVYFSKFGRTKQVAEAIARGANSVAEGVLEAKEIVDPVDVLFLGGAPYANIMAPELRDYAEKLDASKIKKVVLFTTAAWSRRTVISLKSILKGKGIEVENDFFYAQSHHIEEAIQDAEAFGKKYSE